MAAAGRSASFSEPDRNGPATTCVNPCAWTTARAARVELDAVALAACDRVALAVVEAQGFTHVVAAPFRSGSLNDALRPASAIQAV